MPMRHSLSLYDSIIHSNILRAALKHPIFPFVFFDRAPAHNIIHLATERQRDPMLLSGTSNGECCLWKLDKESSSYEPIALFVRRTARETRITSLLWCRWRDRSVFLVASNDGILSCWCAESLRSLFTFRMFSAKYPPTQMQLIGHQHLLGWSSGSTTIYLARLDNYFTLPRLSLPPGCTIHRLLITLCYSDASSYHVNFFLLTEDAQLLEIHFTLPLDTPSDYYVDPTDIANGNWNHEELDYSIIRSSDLSKLCSISIDCMDIFYIQQQDILLLCTSTHILPLNYSDFTTISSLVPLPDSIVALKYDCIPDIGRIVVVSCDAAYLLGLPNFSIANSMKLPNDFSVSSLVHYGNILFFSSISGRILQWVDETYSMFDFSSVFSFRELRSPEKAPCTASTMFCDYESTVPILVKGFLDGYVMADRLESNSVPTFVRVFESPVTAILGIPSQPVGLKHIKTPLIIVGNSHGAVAIYRLDTTCDMIEKTVFHMHYLSITSLLRPLPESIFFSIADDLMVCVYCLDQMACIQQFAGHDSKIVDIYRNDWCVDNDYVVVKTIFGTVYVWVLSTGYLERKISSNEASLFLATNNFAPLNHVTYLEFSENFAAREMEMRNSDNAQIFLNKTQTPKISASHFKRRLTLSSSSPYLPKLGIKTKILNDPDSPGLGPQIEPNVEISELSLDINTEEEKKTVVKPVKHRPIFQIIPSSVMKFLPANFLLLNIESLAIECKHKVDSIDSFDISKLSLYTFLPFLLDWDVPWSDDILSLQVLNVNRPYLHTSTAILSIPTPNDQLNETIAIFLPSAYNAFHYWCLSGHLTAFHLFAISTLCYALMGCPHPPLKAFVNHVLAHYTGMLPSVITNFAESSLEMLALVIFHRNEEVYTTARTLLTGVISRMKIEEKQELLEQWSTSYLFSPSALRPKSLLQLSARPRSKSQLLYHDKELMAIYVISHIIIKNSSLATNDLCERIIFLLSEALSHETDVVRLTLVVEIVGDGIFLWVNHIADIHTLMLRLWYLHWSSMQDKRSFIRILADASYKSLLNVAAAKTKSFVLVMGQHATTVHLHDRERAAALMSIQKLSKKYPLVVFEVLPTIVETITASLDPSEPAIRRSLLEASTRCLHFFVQKYPMVSFDQKTQHFAVGTRRSHKSSIIIYDLRTATKFRIFQGHTGDVTAVAFNHDASILASYSHNESPPSLRAWKTGSTGFFGLLGIQGHCIFQVPLQSIIPEIRQIDVISSVVLKWDPDNKKKISLKRENGMEKIFTLI